MAFSAVYNHSFLPSWRLLAPPDISSFETQLPGAVTLAYNVETIWIGTRGSVLSLPNSTYCYQIRVDVAF